MINIEEILNGHAIFNQRRALYYLSRYIKQAKFFKNYEKDIFIDSGESVPSENVVTLTNEMIATIEKNANKKASEFMDNEYHFWMDKIAEVEDNLDLEPNDDMIQKAIHELNNFEDPKP